MLIKCTRAYFLSIFPLHSPPRPRTAIPAHLFIGHVASLHSDGGTGFDREYAALQALTEKEEFPADSSGLADNKLKNRYHNVVACEFGTLESYRIN